MKSELNILVCPECLASLVKKKDGLICEQCGKIYKTDEGIIDFIRDSLKNRTKIDNDQYLDVEADFYDRIHLHMLNENELLKEIIQGINTSGKVILDIGTGTGFILDNFSALQKEGNFICLDISRNMLKKALLKHERRIYSAIRADAESLPVRDNSTDMITISSTLHHLPNPGLCLREIYRVLKPGGIFLIFHEPILVKDRGLLFKACNILCKVLNHVWEFYITRRTLKRRKLIKGYAGEIFDTNGEEGIRKMSECNRITNVQEGFNTLGILNKELFNISEIKTYFPKRTIFYKILSTFFPNEGELFYILAKKK